VGLQNGWHSPPFTHLRQMLMLQTLNFRDKRNAFRLLASGRDVSGKRILSDELAACIGMAYTMTWKKVIQMANKDFALGVNQVGRPAR
jgi:hypothetical protein